jgi:hypothetical protein
MYVSGNHREEIMNVENVDLKGGGLGYFKELILS